MPLASDRSAALKRAQAVEAEKRERKRMRKSLPSTFPSSLSVDERKTRQSRARRASLQKQESESSKKENEENTKQGIVRQGPTPYWKVVEERGGDISPRQTRSAKKKKLPPRHATRRNGVMVFSPPDQALNEKNQKEFIRKQELEREQRIQKSRNSGNLLVFSPTHREGSSGLGELSGQKQDDSSYPAPESCANAKPSENNEADSMSDLSTPNISQGNDNEQLTQDVRTLCEAVTEIVQSNRNTEKLEKNQQDILIELAATKAKNETLETIKINLEETVESLQKEIRDVHAQRLSEREQIASDKIRQENEIDRLRSDLQDKIDQLNERKSNYESKLDQLTNENVSAVAKQKELDLKLRSMQNDCNEQTKKYKQLQEEYELTKKSLEDEKQTTLEENSHLRRKLENLTDRHNELEKIIHEYQTKIDSLEKELLPEKIREVSEGQEKIREQKETIQTLEGTVKDLQKMLKKLEQDKHTLQNDLTATRQSLCEKAEDFRKSIAELQGELSSKNEQITGLENRIVQTDASTNELHEIKKKMISDFDNERKDYTKRIRFLDEALLKATRELEDASKLSVELQKRIDALELQLKTQAKNQAQIQEKNSTFSLSLQKAQALSKHLEGQNREKQSRIVELERKLAIKESENNDLREHVNEQKPREAALYQRLQMSDEIRRELHAKVMQLMGNIRVFVRVRPVLDGETASSLIRFPGHEGSTSSDDITKKLVEMIEPKKDRGGLSDRRKKWKFAFDEVFPPKASQNQVWDATEPLVQSAIDGFNVTIFAYGQTGSGKTYTLLGDGQTCRGLIGRSIEKLFNTKAEIEATSEGQSSVQFSVEMLEVYNEDVRDLLAPGVGADGKLLPLKVNSQEVVGNEVMFVQNDQEILNVLNTAQKRRCVKSTASNAASSRSHLLFTVNIKVTLESGVQRTGKLNICDLAGSERLDKSGAHLVGGSLLQESKAINKSLSVLSHVIEKLQAGSPTVPFRESKLTFLLRNSLIGNSKTLAIVCCSPVETNHHETLCSLRFAEKANKVELNKAVAKFSC